MNEWTCLYYGAHKNRNCTLRAPDAHSSIMLKLVRRVQRCSLVCLSVDLLFRLHNNLFCLKYKAGNVRAAFPGESELPSYAALPSFVPPCVQCFRVSITPAVRPTRTLLRQRVHYGIFKVRTSVGACRTHEEGSGTNTSAQEMTRRDIINVFHLAPPGVRTKGHRIRIPTL